MAGQHAREPQLPSSNVVTVVRGKEEGKKREEKFRIVSATSWAESTMKFISNSYQIGFGRD